MFRLCTVWIMILEYHSLHAMHQLWILGVLCQPLYPFFPVFTLMPKIFAMCFRNVIEKQVLCHISMILSRKGSLPIGHKLDAPSLSDQFLLAK